MKKWFGLQEIVDWQRIANEANILNKNRSGVPYKNSIDYEQVYGCKVYKIYVIEKGDFTNTYFPPCNCWEDHYATSLAYDLGKLEPLDRCRSRSIKVVKNNT